MPSAIVLRCNAEPLEAAIDEFGDLLALPDSELDVDGLGKFRKLLGKLFAESALDFSNLVCVHSDAPTGLAGDVLLSFHPSDLFLELLAALRTGDRDGI